jgi:hypothetical protein
VWRRERTAEGSGLSHGSGMAGRPSCVCGRAGREGLRSEGMPPQSLGLGRQQAGLLGAPGIRAALRPITASLRASFIPTCMKCVRLKFRMG